MGDISEVYGCIVGASFYPQVKAMHELNRQRIAALPETDSWPYLTRDMFALPREEHNYGTQVIPFAASYNQVERAWEQWLTKFEALLSMMYLDAAYVHLHTQFRGKYSYTWKPSGEPGRIPVSDNLPPPFPVVFSGGPRVIPI